MVQNPLSACLLSKHIKITTHRTIIFPFIMYDCECWSVTLMAEHGAEEYKQTEKAGSKYVLEVLCYMKKQRKHFRKLGNT